MLSQILPISSYEIALSRIAYILAHDFASIKSNLNQYIETEPDDIQQAKWALSCIPDKVWEERITKPSDSDMPYVNIMFAERKKAETISIEVQKAESLFLIECWTSSAATQTDLHGTASGKKLNKLTAMVSQILRHPSNKYLKYEGNFNYVASTDASRILVGNPEYGADSAKSYAQAGVTFSAKLWDTPIIEDMYGFIEGLDTTMRHETITGEIYWAVDLP